jgi:type IV secretory pathway TrbF-like protein
MASGMDQGIIGAISAREARADRRAWLAQLVALVAIGIGVLLAVQRSMTTTTIVEPFVVGVTDAAQVIVLGNLSHQWTLQEVWVRDQLARWIDNIASLSTDSVEVQRKRAEAWAMMIEPGKMQLHSFLGERPLKLVGDLAVAVTLERLTPTGNGRTWEMQYTEHRTDMKAMRTEAKAFTGFITVSIRKPEVVDGQVNLQEVKHLGIWVESFSVRPRLLDLHAKESW